MKNHADAGLLSLHLQDSAVAGVLAYTIQRKSGACGTTIGADGSGDFAVVIYGSPFDAHEKASAHLQRMEEQGFAVKNYIFVPQIECYSGMPIKELEAMLITNGGA
jgi:hypothetical protein